MGKDALEINNATANFSRIFCFLIQVFLRANLKKDRINLVEIHVAHKTPEMDVLVDLNSSLMSLSDGKPGASRHRQTELNMLISPDFRNGIGKKFRLITYSDAIKEIGLENMKSNTPGGQ